MISPEIVEIITSRLTQWKRTGYQIKALCPFHSERNPSFYFDLERGIWHCFGCQRGGDLKSLLEALAPELALHLYTYKTQQNEKYQMALSFYESLPNLFEREDVLSFVERKRRISRDILSLISPKWGDEEVVKNFNDKTFINFAKRVIFPNRFQNRLSSYIGYALNGEQPKYYYPPFLRPLVPFGWEEMKNEMVAAKQIFVTEGIFDMLSLWQIGLPALSVSGNTITKLPAIIPSDVEIILLPDNPKVDKSGMVLGAQWAVSCLMFGRWDAKIAVFPSFVFKDANEALVANSLEEQIEKLEYYPLPQFLIHVAQKGISSKLSVDFVLDLIARYVPFDLAMDVLRWVKKRYPWLSLKLHSAIEGYSDIDDLYDRQQHWKIVAEAARSERGRQILRSVFLDTEIPHLLSQEVVQEKCVFPDYVVMEAAKVAAKQLRYRKARQLKSYLVQLGFLPPDAF